MRLVFVNRFYWPETPATAQLLTDLAEALARAGEEVHVVTSQGGALPPRESRHGVTIHRVRGTRWSARARKTGWRKRWRTACRAMKPCGGRDATVALLSLRCGSTGSHGRWTPHLPISITRIIGSC